MKIAHDIFAETNPAYCASVLAEFTKGYILDRIEGPETPLAYLALPIALSGDLAHSFDSTNKNTGLLEWLDRNPRVRLGLADRLNSSLDVVSDALRFGCFAHMFTVETGARLHLGAIQLKARSFNGLGGELLQTIKISKRLGYWFATAGSTRSIFDIMGLTV